MAKLKTGRHTSALKELRRSQKHQTSNKAVRSRLQTLKKRIEALAESKNKESAEKLLRTTFSEWDKAARRNIVHSNTAANQKARLSKLVKAIQ